MTTTTFELNDEGKLEPVQDYPVVLNQIAYFHGYGRDRERLAVIKIVKSDWGTNYHLLNLDKPSLCVHQYLKPIELRKGTPIGIYFKQGELATQEEIDEVMPMAEAAEQRQADQRKEVQRIADEKTEIAKKWWADNTPKWAKAYIVAELKKDESDSQSDYFNASTQKTLLLAWSASDHLNFKEMREAGRQAPKEIENLDELKEDRYHRILGNYYHGWTIRKYRIGSGWNTSYVSDPENVRLKSGHVYNLPEQQFESDDSGTRVVLNTEKQGVEIYFKTRPNDATLNDLKANGFRWGKTNKCWYKKDNIQAREVAARYGMIPTESNDDGLLVEAQENAGADNWAQVNL